MDGLKSRPQKKKLSKNLLQMKSTVRVVPQKSLLRNPSCPHGPQILFKRENSGKKFYACSAYRDPKQCARTNNVELIRPKKTPWDPTSSPTPHIYCHTCEALDTDESPHKGHRILKDFDIRRPSTFLKPLNNDKAQAQYHFSPETSDFILKALLHPKAEKSGGASTGVLCIGAPTIHEMLLQKGVPSLLMDIDPRLSAFYPMTLYNMFNHHFLHPEDKETYSTFLKADGIKSLSIIIDPPFGGKVELLADTLRRIRTEDWKAKIRILWIFPYFNEKSIVESCSELTMMGVPIEYANHSGYSRRKQGSPVRLYTNVSYKDIPLPGGIKGVYRRCHVCSVISSGPHCMECNVCPAKNGGVYVHCSACRRCVKDSWVHCEACGRCALTDHPCELFKQSKAKQKS